MSEKGLYALRNSNGFYLKSVPGIGYQITKDKNEALKSKSSKRLKEMIRELSIANDMELVQIR